MSLRAAATIWLSTALMAEATRNIAWTAWGIFLLSANVLVTYFAYYFGKKEK